MGENIYTDVIHDEINQQTAWRLRHGPPPKKNNHSASQFFKALDLVISGGFPTCRRNTSGFHIMRPPRISSDSWLIFYHEFCDWMIGFHSDSTVWALKGSSVLLRGKLRIWFALSPWRYLHGCWLHCPQRPDAGDSTFGRSWFDFLCYAKQPRSCHQGKRWNGEILRLSWISLIGSSPYIKGFQGAGTSSSYG